MSEELDETTQYQLEKRADTARATVIAGFVGLAAFALLYRGLLLGGLEQSAAMFVGLPTLLATMTVMIARPKTAIGTAIMVATLALLASAIVFQEGFLCVAFTAPLFYGVAIGVAILRDYLRGKNGGPRAFAAALLPLLLLGSEGVLFSLPRASQVTAVAFVPHEIDAVRAALAQSPDLSTPLPWTLSIGFPRPVGVDGSGLEPGDRRTIDFAGGEGHPGTLTLAVKDEGHRIRFTRLEDTSHIDHWLGWEQSVVRLREVEGGTEVSWTVHYTRKLDPAWYFDPLQRIAMQSAAAWLIEANARPDQR